MNSETQGGQNLQNESSKSNTIKTDSDLEDGTNPKKLKTNDSQED